MSCHGRIRRKKHHVEQIQVFHKTQKKQIEVITLTTSVIWPWPCYFAKLWGSNMVHESMYLVLFPRGFYVSSVGHTWNLATQESRVSGHIWFFIPSVDGIQNGTHIYNPVLRLWLNQPIWKKLSQVANLPQAGVNSKNKKSLKPPPSHSTRFLKNFMNLQHVVPRGVFPLLATGLSWRMVIDLKQFLPKWWFIMP